MKELNELTILDIAKDISKEVAGGIPVEGTRTLEFAKGFREAQYMALHTLIYHLEDAGLQHLSKKVIEIMNDAVNNPIYYNNLDTGSHQPV